MTSKHDFNQLLLLFPNVERGLMQDIYESSDRNYQVAFQNLASIFPSPPVVNVTSRVTKRPSSDHEQIQQWSNPTENQDRQHFQDITAKIAIVPELMASSHMDQNMAVLKEIIQNKPIVEPINTTVESFVAAAFNLRSPSGCRSFVGSDPGGITSGGNFYDGCIALYHSLPEWQRPLFHGALREMCQPSNISRDRTHLQITCGLILRGSRECNARKQEVFFNVIQRSIRGENHPSDSAIHTAGNPSTSSEQQIEYHKMKLFAAAMTPIDELKDCAFRAIFLEPTKMYFRAVGDQTMEGDTEVHGSNVYLAILLSCLSIKLSRSPLLSDEVKGVAQIKEGLKRADLEKLWNPDNNGARWQTIFRNKYPSARRRVNRNRFYSEGYTTAKQVAINCDKKSVEPYLVAYARFFEHDLVIPRLCNYFLSQDHLHHHLDAIFLQLATEEEIEESNREAKYWLWDVLSGEFRVDRGSQMLQYAGILKDVRG
eukprot:CAMPEP_0203665706 /NCGR_PEP_ID=MMETSP0090-20130426/2873_1 /ASSEMBLY_ACC=CAM_ASM_001088 /TAXON_ID=426623 /ORGANISM="Chaetoceros affinis, Strain CCMP159" /LENGTH=483 /DNA_ID=CAMNT_0050529353 /DNA_START=33 /DNA_END=1484 /DNA_ORIENTATION=-